MSPARALLDALIAFYERPGRRGDLGAASMLDRALPALRDAEAVTIAPRTLPVADLLQPALARLETPLADALCDAASLYRWRQNPNYTAANMGAEFMVGYGYVEFVGPKEASFHAPAIRVGLLVLGPGRHYPTHTHPAEEVYHPLTAGGDWRRGEEDWRQVTPGSAIYHPPTIAHETRAGSETLLALYCWAGDTSTEARLQS
jgi:quercetin dioxygenase-like cupin family protein